MSAKIIPFPTPDKRRAETHFRRCGRVIAFPGSLRNVCDGSDTFMSLQEARDILMCAKLRKLRSLVQ